MAPVTFTEVRGMLKEDRARLRAAAADDPRVATRWLCFTPSFQAVWLHRWSHYFFVAGHRGLARLLWHLNLLLTGADISPLTAIGPGLVIRSTLGLVLVGRAGANLTLHAHASFGAGMATTDVGAGPGLPWIGDGVELGPGAIILGPVRVGDGAHIGARCIVTTNIPERASVAPARQRVRQARASEPEASSD